MKYITIIILSCIFLSNTAKAEYDDPFYDYRGQNPFRASHLQQPQERYDPFTGNITLIYTDIYLPGPGGLDIKVMRVYNSDIRRWVGPNYVYIPDSWVGLGWSMHMGQLVEPTFPDYRYLIMPDGSKHKFYEDINNPGQFISKDYWILEADGLYWYVFFPDGKKWIFHESVSGLHRENSLSNRYYPTVVIADPQGNTIGIQYQEINDQTPIQKIISVDREINFQYQTSGAMNLEKIEVLTQTGWAYYEYEYTNLPSPLVGYSLLKRVKFPEDPIDTYTYEYDYYTGPLYELAWRKDTYGDYGKIYYTFETRTVNNRYYRVLSTRTHPHGGGSWTYNYNVTPFPEQYDSTSITDVYNTTTSYIHCGYHSAIQNGSCWKVGLLYRKHIIGTEANLLLTYNYSASPAISNEDYDVLTHWDNHVYVPRLTDKDVTIDNQTYSTDYSSFDNYSHPRTIVETGDEVRTITRSYWLCPGTDHYIIDWLASENITIGSGTYSISYNYYEPPSAWVGRLQTQNNNGITTTYTYYDNGDVKRSTDETGRWVEYGDYRYGLWRAMNKNDVYVKYRTIDWAGCVRSETDGNNYTTDYNYDKNWRLKEIRPPVESGDLLTQITYGYIDGHHKIVSQGASVVSLTDLYIWKSFS